MKLAALTVLCLCIFPVTAQGNDDSATSPSWQLQFTGLERFSEQSVRRAVARDLTLIQAARDGMPHPKFADLIQKRLAEGLRLHGFPEASVTVSSGAPDQFQATIDCGPEYKWGEIRIDAPPESDVASLERIVKNWNDPRYRVLNQVQSWRPENPTFTGQEFASKLKTQMEASAKKDLRDGFDCSVEFEYKTDTHQIIPVIKVLQPGFHTLISEVIIAGNVRDSAEDILQYLELPKDFRLTGELQRSIQQRILDSGRFLHVSVYADAPFADHHAVPLHIDVREYEQAVSLSQPLNEFDQAVLRMAKWWSDPDPEKNDFQLTMSAPITTIEEAAYAIDMTVNETTREAGEFSLWKALELGNATKAELTATMSREHGAIVSWRITDDADKVTAHVVLLLTTEATGIADCVQHRRWTQQWDYATLINRMQLKGLSPENERRVAWFFSPGWTTLNGISMVSEFEAEPAAVLLSVKEAIGTSEPVLKDGIWVVDAPSMTISFHNETGRIDKIRWADEQTRSEVRCAPGLLQQEIQATFAASPDNMCVDGQSLSSFVRFLLPYVERGMQVPDDATFRLAEKALKQNSSLDRLVDTFIGREPLRKFSLPTDPKIPTQNRESQPWVLTWLESGVAGTPTDRALALFGPAKNNLELQKEFIRNLKQQTDIGPVGCLLIASLCNGVSRDVAAIGLERLDFDHFLLDMSPVLEPNTQWMDAFTDFISFVRSTSDEESELTVRSIEKLSLLVDPEQQFPVTANSIRPVMLLIRKGNASTEDTARQLLQLAWEPLIKDLIAKQLVIALNAKGDGNPIQFVSESNTPAPTIPSAAPPNEAIQKSLDAANPATILESFQSLDSNMP